MVTEAGEETKVSTTTITTTKTTTTTISSQAEAIIALLGGRENIELVDACMTRLRVTVKDPQKVAEIDKWRENGALGLFKKGNGIQAVYGPKADILKSDINDILQ
jgi:PTS system glucose-specific IIC component